MQLNPQQQQAVKHIQGPLLVLAGAGSGKTRVITEKIAYLIRHCHVPSHLIYAVTFTNKAAREMQNRVKQSLARSESRGIHISTFHTLGLSILKKHGHFIGLRSPFSIYDQEDVSKLIRSLLDCDKATAQIMATQLSRWKNDQINPSDAANIANTEFLRHCAQLYQDYQTQLMIYNAVDFDDLIYLALLILQTYPETLSFWQNRLRYLLIDEYQDTNLCQYQLIKQLVGIRQAVTVVGDDDQSIYAWRGARPENILTLQQDFPNLQIIKLEQNYRSSQRILRAANTVIAHNPHIFTKKLWSEYDDGAMIQIKQCQHPEQEAEFVSYMIAEHALKNGKRYADYAILYRSNYHARLFELALRRHQIPYQVVGGSSFFDQTEVKDIIAYLKLIVNLQDTPSLLRIINVPKREIGAAALKKIAEFAQVNQLSLFDAMLHSQHHHFLGHKTAGIIREFAEFILQLNQSVTHQPPSVLITQLIEQTAYIEHLANECNHNKTALERRIHNLNSLKESIERTQTNLAEALAHLSLLSLLDQQTSATETEQAVTLMTLHSAKGLEFPYVHLVSIEEDVLPHKNAIDHDMVEEERRLFYVGLTRAQKNLIISYCQQRKRYGEWESCTESRFLHEMPTHDLKWQYLHEKNSDDKLVSLSAENALGMIKAMLNNN